MIKNTKSKKSPVYGWAIEDNKVIPIFNSEKNIYNGKIYRTIAIAARHIKEN
jgi:hypothetical protein